MEEKNNIVDLDEYRALAYRDREWWDKWFLGMCVYAASASKDPSTQCGSVIVRPNKTIVGIGYNGFPRGIEDSYERLHDRQTKYKYMVHAETNAICNCILPPVGCILYCWPFAPCSRCATQIIQAGIRRVVFNSLPDEAKERWGEDMELAKKMLDEAGLSWSEYPLG